MPRHNEQTCDRYCVGSDRSSICPGSGDHDAGHNGAIKTTGEKAGDTGLLSVRHPLDDGCCQLVLDSLGCCINGGVTERGAAILLERPVEAGARERCQRCLGHDVQGQVAARWYLNGI